MEAVRVLSSPAPPPAKTAPHHPKRVCGPRCVAWVQAVHQAQLAAYLNAVWLASLGLPPDAGTQQVMACIRSVESGNYSESSHPGSGSGAYQFTPGTWTAWYGRWRDAVAFVGSDYPYAYSAPPLIQDAVTAYALTHGGAHNWDPAYGPDSCTVGMP